MYERAHRALQHPTKSSELEMWRRAFCGSLPPHVREIITERQCEICEKTAALPRRPRVAVPHGPEINNVVTVDSMTFNYKSRMHVALVVMDEANSLISLALLSDSTAAHSLEQYIVHHASKYGNARLLYQTGDQTSPVPTGIINSRSATQLCCQSQPKHHGRSTVTNGLMRL